MILDQIGALLIGSIVGWLLVFTMRKKGMDWKVFGEVVVLIVGGSQLTMVAQKDLTGLFWIGTFAGFVVNILVHGTTKANIATMQ